MTEKNITHAKPLSEEERTKQISDLFNGHDARVHFLHTDITLMADRLLTMWLEKVHGYGTSRYDHHDIDFDAWMNFSDVYRKHIRLEQLTRRVASGETEALPDLLDAYADMATYAMSALVVMNRHVREED